MIFLCMSLKPFHVHQLISRITSLTIGILLHCARHGMWPVSWWSIKSLVSGIIPVARSQQEFACVSLERRLFSSSHTGSVLAFNDIYSNTNFACHHWRILNQKLHLYQPNTSHLHRGRSFSHIICVIVYYQNQGLRRSTRWKLFLQIRWWHPTITYVEGKAKMTTCSEAVVSGEW